LDSIARQEKVLVSLLISDDNSSDRTLEIAREYATSFQSFEIISGPNKGPCLNFMQALAREATKQFEFFALVDQDDIWLKNHLFDSIDMIGRTSEPVLVYSPTIKINEVDKQVKFYLKSRKYLNYRNGLVANFAQGCTMVMNAEAQRLVINFNSEYIIMHDWWIRLVVDSTGKVLHKLEPSVLYRIHDGNFVGSPNFKKRSQLYIRMVLFGQFRTISQLKSLVELHGSRMEAQKLREIEILLRFLTENFFQRLRMALLLKRYRETLIEEIGFRILLVFKVN